MVRKHPFPDKTEQLADLRTAIRTYVLPGYIPEKPILPATTGLLTMGSCFAENIHAALERAGYASRNVGIGEMANTPAFANFLVNSLKAGHLGSLVAHSDDTLVPQKILANVRAALPAVGAFILTLGVAIQPFKDGKPAFFTEWSPLTKTALVASEWRMLSIDEILNYVRSTITGLRALRPGIPIFLTLSPIPLLNAMLHESVIAQDCISKSRIRVALDDLMDEAIPDVYYWPSFEIVRWLGGHVGPFFGAGGVDQRHVAPEILDLITGLFIETFFEPKS